MFLNIFFGRLRCIRAAVKRRRCCTDGISMPSVLAITGLVIAVAATVAWTVLLGYGLFALIEGVL
jgi:hypothetical protein